MKKLINNSYLVSNMSEESIWYKWFGLNQNPFNTSPLNKNQINLFYKTSEISKKIDPLLSELSTNVPTLKLIIGPRGLGKTTIFHYIKWKADEIPNLVPLYIDATYETTKIDNPSIVIAESILNNFLEEIFNYLFLNKSEIWNKYKSSIDTYMNNIGFVMDHSGVLKNPTISPIDMHFVNLKRISQNMLKICQDNNIRFLLLIDNIDKGNLDPPLTFFRDSISQSLFENFVSTFNSTIYISGKNELHEEMMNSKYVADYSYLQDAVILNQLTPLESYKIIEQRFKSSSYDLSEEIPLEFEVINDIWMKNKGITRDILIDVKNLLQKAFQFKEKLITHTLYKSRRFNTKENLEIFSKIIEEDVPSRKGYESLMGLYTFLNRNTNKFKNATNLLTNVYYKKRLSEENQIFLSELVKKKFLTFDNEKKHFLIRDDINYFFNKLTENGINLSEFFVWYINDQIEEIPIECNKIFPEGKLSELKEQSNKHEWNEVTISKPDKYYSLSDKELNSRVDNFFELSLRSYKRLSSADWDEIENTTIFNDIWNVIFNVCKSITYLLASYQNDDITYGIGDRKNDWDNIYYFIIQKGQKDFFYLDNWNFIRNLYILRKKIIFEKSYEPSREELMEWYSNIDKTIDELYNFWVQILSHISEVQNNEIIKKVIHEHDFSDQIIGENGNKQKKMKPRDDNLNDISEIGNKIINKRKNINSAAKLCGEKSIFKPTDMTEVISSQLPTLLCNTEKKFKLFIENIYVYIIESSGDGKRLKDEHKNSQVYKDIKELRNHFEHDREHGNNSVVKKKYEKVGAIYAQLLGKKVPNDEEWTKLQILFMNKILDLLNEISKSLNR